MPLRIEGLGWIRQNPDLRDIPLALPAAMDLPPWVDLHQKMPPIWNQGRLGSCTAHGSLAAYWYDRGKENEPTFMPSRLFEYYNGRSLLHTTLVDSGCTVRDAIKAIGQWGSCDEALWPYDTSKFAVEPPAAAYTEAAKHKALKYYYINNDLYSIKATLASGYPIVFGFMVYSNFEQAARTGLMPWPRGIPEGGHCVCAVGYNSKNLICCRNSWTNKWGDPNFAGGGYFWMAPEIITNRQIASDLWVISKVQA
jgi:C1A family cysteine protease